MRFSQLGAVTALTAVSQAFLLPPTINAADSEIVNTLPFDIAADIDGRVVNVDCPGCPVVITNLLGQSKYASAPVESMLRFNFSLEHGETDHLMVNGRQIFPLELGSQAFTKPLTADQLIKSPDGTWNYAASPELGYGIMTSFPESSSNQEELQLVVVRLETIEVAGRFIDTLPAIEVKLLQTLSGKLMIGDAQLAETSAGFAKGSLPLPSRPAKPTECTNIICEWRAVIADKISKMKGCGGKRPAHTGGAVAAPTRPFIKPGHGAHSKPHHAHGGHRPHGHHRHRHGRFVRLIRSIVFHVFVPIMIGVVVGITASLVGMIVGHIVIFVWRVLFRRGERAQYCRFQEEAVEKSDDDESKGFLEHENAPPVYEDAPAYEEAVVEKV